MPKLNYPLCFLEGNYWIIGEKKNIEFRFSKIMAIDYCNTVELLDETLLERYQMLEISTAACSELQDQLVFSQ